MLFRLEHVSGQSDVKCPHCNQGYDLDWDTEYGEPSFGQHDATCPNCEKEFEFEVYIKYTKAIPK